MKQKLLTILPWLCWLIFPLILHGRSPLSKETQRELREKEKSKRFNMAVNKK